MEKTETPADLRRRLGDGRQYGTSLKEIKENHVHRYNWAAEGLRARNVVDVGCGVGYGSWILGKTGTKVTGLDFNPSLIEVAAKYWGRDNVEFQKFNLQSGLPLPTDAEAIVAFEVLEHLVCPEWLLCSIPKGTLLFGSVPNQEHAPHSIASNPFHIRHYTYHDIEELLVNCGFSVTAWYHQNFEGIAWGQLKAKTILFTAERHGHQCPQGMEDTFPDRLQFEFLRRCNVICDLKNGRDTKRPTAF